MHRKAEPEPVKLQSVNADNGLPLNDLEAMLLCFQTLIEGKQAEGKKGIVLYKGQASQYKMSYAKLQALLWELHTLFGMRGAFSFGICGDCIRFDNSCSADGTYGRCDGREKYMFDSCDKHEGGGGHGKAAG